MGGSLERPRQAHSARARAVRVCLTREASVHSGRTGAMAARGLIAGRARHRRPSPGAGHVGGQPRGTRPSGRRSCGCIPRRHGASRSCRSALGGWCFLGRWRYRLSEKTGWAGFAGRCGVARPTMRRSRSAERSNSGGAGLRWVSAVVRAGVAVVMECLVVDWDVGRAAHVVPLRAMEAESWKRVAHHSVRQTAACRAMPGYRRHAHRSLLTDCTASVMGRVEGSRATQFIGYDETVLSFRAHWLRSLKPRHGGAPTTGADLRAID